MFEQSLYIAIENDYANPNIRHKSLAIASAVAGAGCDAIQYRARGISYYKMLDEAKSIGQICKDFNIPFIINNHIDLALDVNADGVHLSHEEVSVKQTRAIMGPQKIIGLTIRSREDAQNAMLEPLDYVTVAGIFATEVDLNNQTPIGLKGLKSVQDIIQSRAPDLPIFAIGGINDENVADVVATGVCGVSVIGAVSQVKKPAVIVRKLKKIIIKAAKSS